MTLLRALSVTLVSCSCIAAAGPFLPPPVTLAQADDSALSRLPPPSLIIPPGFGPGEADQNPYSRGIGERVAGTILLVQGVWGLARGIYGDVRNSTAGAAAWISPRYADRVPVWVTETLDKVTWIEGGVRLACAIPLLSIGITHHARWKRWEREERELKPAGGVVSRRSGEYGSEGWQPEMVSPDAVVRQGLLEGGLCSP